MEAWMERWNRAMDEIEQNLTGQIDYERLGRIACCSAYHFQRMFPYLAGAAGGIRAPAQNVPRGSRFASREG